MIRKIESKYFIIRNYLCLRITNSFECTLVNVTKVHLECRSIAVNPSGKHEKEKKIRNIGYGRKKRRKENCSRQNEMLIFLAKEND